MDTIFGFSNRVPQKIFVEKFANQGWKYFNLASLNDLFFIMYQKYGTISVPLYEAIPSFGVSLSNRLFNNFAGDEEVVAIEDNEPEYATPTL